MASIGETLIKLFDGKQSEVYLGKVEPTEVSQPKEKKKFNILESISNTLSLIFLNANPFQVITRRKRAREEEERQRKLRKLEALKSIKKSRDIYNNNRPTSPLHKDVTEFVQQKWIDNIDRPDISVGREYLQNIKKALVKNQASPSQITETLFRDTFRKKQFSENNITTLWGEYNVWVRSFKSSYRGTYR